MGDVVSEGNGVGENAALYFKRYRESIGFTNQSSAKQFLAGKDVVPQVDFRYVDSLNARLVEIISRINVIADECYQRADLDAFFKENIFEPYDIIRRSSLLPMLNNQGRRPEQVLFSWLRGFSIAAYFIPALSKIFSVPLSAISQMGDDDLRNVATFRRSPKADFEMIKNNKKVRIEVQSGFQGINDIKEHKVREARSVYHDCGEHSVCVHVDLFNGQVAFVQLDLIQSDDVHFVTRQQMEGQSVFAIDQNHFKWRLLDPPPSLGELELSL